MALARLSATLGLIIQLLQVSYGQQLSPLGLNNKPGLSLNNGPLGSPQQALQRKAGLISNPKNFNQISKLGNVGPNLLQQQSNILNSQQLGNLQSINFQQPLNCQQQLNLQNLQQSLPNQNCQSLNFPQQSNVQQQILQQQQSSLPVSNIQLVPQQRPGSTCDIPLSSLPIVNGQITGLPSQVSQGVLLSNLGLTSSLPNLLPNGCPQQMSDQISILSQNNLGTMSNVPISFMDGSQAISSPFSLSPSSLNAALNNPTSSVTLPVSPQSITQQTQQAFDLQQICPIQNQQVSLKSIQQFPMQSQPAAASVQSQPFMPAFILSPNTSPQYAPGSTTYASTQPSNHGSKSSSLKSLLPFLFNLLKDKPPCCGCRQNKNCGCANNNINNMPIPQVSDGYSNQINYSQNRQTKEESTNTIDSEEFESSEALRKRRKYRNFNNRDNDSKEYDVDDYAEDYDNED